MTSIDWFFRLTGRGNGWISPVLRSISVSSSDSSRQPDSTSAGSQRAFSRAGRRRQNGGQAVLFDHRSMNDQVMMRMLDTHQFRPHSSMGMPGRAAAA